MADNSNSIDRLIRLIIEAEGAQDAARAVGEVERSANSLDSQFKKTTSSIGKYLSTIKDIGKVSRAVTLAQYGIRQAFDSLGTNSSQRDLADYSRTLLQSRVQFVKFGESILDTERRLLSLKDEFAFSRQEVAKLQSQYEQGFSFQAPERMVQTFATLREVVGENVDAMSSLLSSVQQVGQKVPIYQELFSYGVVNNSEKISKNARNMSRALLTASAIAGDISLDELKEQLGAMAQLEESRKSTDGASKEAQIAQARTDQLNSNIRTLNELKVLWEDITFRVANALHPILENINNSLQKHSGWLEDWVAQGLKIAKIFRAIGALSIFSTLAKISTGTVLGLGHLLGAGGGGGAVGSGTRLTGAFAGIGSTPLRPMFVQVVNLPGGMGTGSNIYGGVGGGGGGKTRGKTKGGKMGKFARGGGKAALITLGLTSIAYSTGFLDATPETGRPIEENESGPKKIGAMDVAARTGSYAMTGAMIGSFFPGPGTGVGAAIGAVAGLGHGLLDYFSQAEEEIKKINGGLKANTEEIEKAKRAQEAQKNKLSATDKVLVGFVARYKLLNSFIELSNRRFEASLSKLDAVSGLISSMGGFDPLSKGLDFGDSLNSAFSAQERQIAVVDKARSSLAQYKDIAGTLDIGNVEGTDAFLAEMEDSFKKIPGIGETLSDEVMKRLAIRGSEVQIEDLLASITAELDTAAIKARAATENIVKSASQRFKGERELAESVTSRVAAEVDLATNLAAGVAPSAEMRMEQVRAIQGEIVALEKELDYYQKIKSVAEKTIKRGLETGDDAAVEQGLIARKTAEQSINGLVAERTQMMAKQASITKVIRDGYIDAIAAMSTGAGMFTQITIDQNKNLGQLQAATNNRVVGMRSGAFARGLTSSERFTAGGIMSEGRRFGASDEVNQLITGSNPLATFMDFDLESDMQNGISSTGARIVEIWQQEAGRFFSTMGESLRTQPYGASELQDYISNNKGSATIDNSRKPETYSVEGYSTGGPILDGDPYKDSKLIAVRKGEHVLNPEAVKSNGGHKFFNDLNSGSATIENRVREQQLSTNSFVTNDKSSTETNASKTYLTKMYGIEGYSKGGPITDDKTVAVKKGEHIIDAEVVKNNGGHSLFDGLNSGITKEQMAANAEEREKKENSRYKEIISEMKIRSVMSKMTEAIDKARMEKAIKDASKRGKTQARERMSENIDSFDLTSSKALKSNFIYDYPLLWHDKLYEDDNFYNFYGITQNASLTGRKLSADEYEKVNEKYMGIRRRLTNLRYLIPSVSRDHQKEISKRMTELDFQYNYIMNNDNLVDENMFRFGTDPNPLMQDTQEGRIEAKAFRQFIQERKQDRKSPLQESIDDIDFSSSANNLNEKPLGVDVPESIVDLANYEGPTVSIQNISGSKQKSSYYDWRESITEDMDYFTRKMKSTIKSSRSARDKKPGRRQLVAWRSLAKDLIKRGKPYDYTSDPNFVGPVMPDQDQQLRSTDRMTAGLTDADAAASYEEMQEELERRKGIITNRMVAWRRDQSESIMKQLSATESIPAKTAIVAQLKDFDLNTDDIYERIESARFPAQIDEMLPQLRALGVRGLPDDLFKKQTSTPVRTPVRQNSQNIAINRSNIIDDTGIVNEGIFSEANKSDNPAEVYLSYMRKPVEVPPSSVLEEVNTDGKLTYIKEDLTGSDTDINHPHSIYGIMKQRIADAYTMPSDTKEQLFEQFEEIYDARKHLIYLALHAANARSMRQERVWEREEGIVEPAHKLKLLSKEGITADSEHIQTLKDRLSNILREDSIDDGLEGLFIYKIQSLKKIFDENTPIMEKIRHKYENELSPYDRSYHIRFPDEMPLYGKPIVHEKSIQDKNFPLQVWPSNRRFMSVVQDSYATGGIVSPRQGGQIARIGEAGKSEAVVPLPDGSSIPVMFKKDRDSIKSRIDSPISAESSGFKNNVNTVASRPEPIMNSINTGVNGYLDSTESSIKETSHKVEISLNNDDKKRVTDNFVAEMTSMMTTVIQKSKQQIFDDLLYRG